MAERTRCVQWMQKALDQMNVQVHRAVADLTGTTGEWRSTRYLYSRARARPSRVLGRTCSGDPDGETGQRRRGGVEALEHRRIVPRHDQMLRVG